jgi:hypothetical protein
MTGIDFGWNVYKYNRQMKVFARVSGEVMYEALRKVKTGEIQKEGADLVSGLLSTLE